MTPDFIETSGTAMSDEDPISAREIRLPDSCLFHESFAQAGANSQNNGSAAFTAASGDETFLGPMFDKHIDICQFVYQNMIDADGQ